MTRKYGSQNWQKSNWITVLYSSCGMTRNTLYDGCAPTGEYNHAAVFARIDSHLHRESLSLPATICRPYQFPMETNDLRAVAGRL